MTGTDSAFDEKALIMSRHYVTTTLDLFIGSSGLRQTCTHTFAKMVYMIMSMYSVSFCLS